MKIIIVTVYNSYNWGSYLQAYALSTVLKKYGKVHFLKTGNRGIFLPFVKLSIMAIASFKIDRILFELKKYQIFRRNHKGLKIVKQVPNNNIDVLMIFGSDEIWNISRKKFKNMPIFLGKGCENFNKISYSPSINNSTTDDFKSHPEILSLLSNFNTLSVRDNHSKNCLEKMLNRQITLTLDPTMLISKHDYFKNAETNNEKNYIALYLHERHISDKYVLNIQAIAKAFNKKLISLNMYIDWCDKNVASNNVFEYYINADYVITTTLHGAAFAINFEKQFITLSSNNKKVTGLLEMFNLMDRNIPNGGFEDMKALLQKAIDYEKVREILVTYRRDSMEYIKNAIQNK